MISVLGRSAQHAPSLKASVQVVASGTKALKPGVILADKPIILNTETDPLNTYSMSKHLPKGLLKVQCGPAVSSQVRCAHTDLKVPDFDYYRRNSTKDPQAKSSDTVHKRNSFNYMLTGGMIVTTTYATKSIVSKFVASMSAAADVVALSKIEISMNGIPEGKSMTFKWRGKPVFIKHRTDKTIEEEANVDLSTLRDPQHDSERVVSPKWLVVVGVCTHLGCVPIADAGDFGGYYCPCHGSHYDSSGRIRLGPAPLNLEVPPVTIKDDLLVIG